MKTNFTALDFLVLVAYLIATTLLGIWLGRNQKDSKDYFVAGHAIPWWAVLFSVVATETSALTFISIPGLAYTTNLGFLQIAAGYLLGRIVVAYTLLPRYYQGDLVTAYALLEKRFGLIVGRELRDFSFHRPRVEFVCTNVNTEIVNPCPHFGGWAEIPLR